MSSVNGVRKFVSNTVIVFLKIPCLLPVQNNTPRTNQDRIEPWPRLLVIREKHVGVK